MNFSYLTPHISELDADGIAEFKKTIENTIGYVKNKSEIQYSNYYVIGADTYISGFGCAKTFELTNYVLLLADDIEEAQILKDYLRSRGDMANVQTIKGKNDLPFFDDNGEYSENVYYSQMLPDWENCGFYRNAKKYADEE